MPTQRNFLINTTTISTTASGTTIVSGNTQSASFVVALTLVRSGIAAGEFASGSQTWSIHYVVSAMATPYEMRLKVQRRNSSGTMQAESGYGTTRSATGTYDDNLTADLGTWAANDQLALVWEHRRPSGTGNKSGTVDANGSSYIDAPTPPLDLPKTAADDVNLLADARGLGYGNLYTDSVNNLADTAQIALGLSLAVNDNANTLTDGEVTVVGYWSAISDSLQALTEALARLLTYQLSLADSEAANWADSHNLLLAQFLALADTHSLSDVVELQAGIALGLTDITTILVDDFAFQLKQHINLTDSLNSLSESLTIGYGLLPADALDTSATSRPNIVYLDPGGDAVEAIGYFNTVVTDGSGISFDSSQQVIGVGSYRFDSGISDIPVVRVLGVLGDARRISCYFRYDSIPDASLASTQFINTVSAYSGGGFSGSPSDMDADDGVGYGLATPTKNAGQGTVFGAFGFGFSGSDAGSLPLGILIDAVKIIYERRYDTDASIGVSRVKYRINGVEGPDHDNTDQPLVDTAVEVDVTADRVWERTDFLNGVFEVIAEARRGDTDVEFTQSWDFLKVEVTYHFPSVILAGVNNSLAENLQLAIAANGSGVSLTVLDVNRTIYSGSSILAVNTWYRLTLAYAIHGVDDLDLKVYIDGIEELSITAAASPGAGSLARLHYGWLVTPGVDHLCWFDQIYIDDGDDLSDPGNVLITAKLPAAVNENEWTTAVGTGAVNERPLSTANYVKHTLTTTARQTYTLQAAAVGDFDISGATFIGYMGWAWAKVQVDDFWDLSLVVNGFDIDRSAQISPTPSLLRYAATSSGYPSDPAGIGMAGNNEAPDTFMYECGVVIAGVVTTGLRDALNLESISGPDIPLTRSDTLPTQVDSLVIGHGLLVTDAIDALTDGLITQSGELLNATDSLTFIDAESHSLELQLAFTESLSFTDSLATGQGLTRADALVSAESCDVRLDQLESFADALAVSDSEEHVLAHRIALVDDAGLLSDSTVFQSSREIESNDSLLALADACVLQLNYQLTFTATITLNDAYAHDLINTVEGTTEEFEDDVDVLADSLVLGIGLVLNDDTNTLADTAINVLDQLLEFNDALADQADEVSLQLRCLLDFTETINLIDSQSSVLSYRQLLTDTLVLTDDESIELSQLLSVSDSIVNLADTYTQLSGGLLSFDDLFILSDSASLGYGLLTTENADFLLDAIETSAPQGPLREVGLTDALAELNDEIALQLDYLLGTTDTISLTDSTATAEGILAALDDVLSLTDAATVTLGQLLSLADTILLDDFAQLEVDFHVELADVIALTDTATLITGQDLALADSVDNLNDAIAPALSHHIALAEGLTLTDDLTVRLDYSKSTTDALALADSVQSQLGYRLTISDAIALTDIATLNEGQQLTLSDNAANWADSVAFTIGLALILNDNAANLTDDFTALFIYSLRLADSFALTDTLTTFGENFLQIADEVVLSDNVDIELRGPDRETAVEDALVLTDAIAISLGNELRYQLVLVDTITLSDHYFDLRHPYTPSAKRHVVVPSRARVTVVPASARETVPVGSRTTKVT